MNPTPEREQKKWLPRVFLRTIELNDLCKFEGAEGDVFTIYSPRTFFITHHEEYLSKKESDHIVSDFINKKNIIIAEKDKRIRELETQIDILTSSGQTKYAIRQYAELDHDGRNKIDNLMKALLEIKCAAKARGPR